jgi:hypothetical protein
MSVHIASLLDARDSDGPRARAFASAIDPAIGIAARETETILADLRLLAPSPDTLSIYGLSFIAGVLWNGQIDRGRRPMCTTRRLTARRFVANEGLPHAISTCGIMARLECNRKLLADLGPLQPLLPTESQQLWAEQQDDECEATPPESEIGIEIERCLANLAGTVGPMAGDLGLACHILMQLDHIAQIPHYRWVPARLRWGTDFFPVPVIASDERVDVEGAHATVRMARGRWRAAEELIPRAKLAALYHGNSMSCNSNAGIGQMAEQSPAHEADPDMGR